MKIDSCLLTSDPNAINDVFREVKEILSELPQLCETLCLPDEKRKAALEVRYEKLGVATLHPDSFDLFLRFFEKRKLVMADYLSPVHEATLRAEDKQFILPHGVLVQKTITVQFNWKLFLATGAGPFTFGPKEQKALVQKLQVARRTPRRFRFNSSILVPEVDLLQLRGIVNPFFMPALEPGLSGIVIVPWPKEYAGYILAIAFSPVESLFLPLSLFIEFLKEFIGDRTDLIYLY